MQRRRFRLAARRLRQNRRKWTPLDVAVSRLLYPEAVENRPKTRADCAGVPRPCPYVGCRWNSYLWVTAEGRIRFVYPDLEPWQVPADRSCLLDAIDRMNGRTPSTREVAEQTGITRQRADQIIRKCLPIFDELAAEYAGDSPDGDDE